MQLAGQPTAHDRCHTDRDWDGDRVLAEYVSGLSEIVCVVRFGGLYWRTLSACTTLQMLARRLHVTLVASPLSHLSPAALNFHL